ncbi:gephyrin-like molybdotransferase receptor GlpR [Streptomyces sp. NPDC050560]|uniref:divisome protein SepX/GlpR n=1 Tax=Streptomyces sp. NPDC050560 TaxID=3365630 RepID=UPI0037969750
MSSSGLIYAVIVGAWAAYLVPMWLRRQDELNEARPTERFSTAIRLLSGRAGMERRYAKDLKSRAADPDEHGAPAPDPDATGSVDVRAFAAPRGDGRTPGGPARRPEVTAPRRPEDGPTPRRPRQSGHAAPGDHGRPRPQARRPVPAEGPGRPAVSAPVDRPGPAARPRRPVRPGAQERQGAARRAAEAAARAQRSKVLARRRRTTVMLFLAFTLGAVAAAVGGLAFLWAPAVPAILLSAYIVYLRGQERRRFTYTMDRRRAEAAALHLRERERQPRRRAASTAPAAADDPEEGAGPAPSDPGLSALAAGRRALVEQTDHAEWVDQQRERRRNPADGESWDPVPVPLPTYVTAPVAPRATGDLDLGAPDTWSSARSSAAGPTAAAEDHADPAGPPEDGDAAPGTDERSDARRAASARRARERGHTPLFDQYADGDRPRAANE